MEEQQKSGDDIIQELSDHLMPRVGLFARLYKLGNSYWEGKTTEEDLRRDFNEWVEMEDIPKSTAIRLIAGALEMIHLGIGFRKDTPPVGPVHLADVYEKEFGEPLPGDD